MKATPTAWAWSFCRHRGYGLAALVLTGSGLTGCEASPPRQPAAAASDSVIVGQTLASPQDSVIVEQTLASARAQRLDTLPIGQIVAHIGRRFVGSPYVPGSLEVEGPERLVVNLRTFDCVTYVESTLSLARTLRAGGGYREYMQELQGMRYRSGVIDGYPSRLHYFSEWISSNDGKGIVQNVTAELGGVVDPEPLTFMTSHRSSYRQLADEAVFNQIGEMERRVSKHTRYYIPEQQIVAAAPRIQDGDVIAAATNIAGLDVAHTGLAIWVDGKLHLMHAPLVGSVVEISAQPLDQRILSIDTQDGIMVARPR